MVRREKSKTAWVFGGENCVVGFEGYIGTIVIIVVVGVGCCFVFSLLHLVLVGLVTREEKVVCI
jgi:type IV secretory pathway VirB3-like protein